MGFHMRHVRKKLGWGLKFKKHFLLFPYVFVLQKAFKIIQFEAIVS
jgi:hypothetical protein